MLRRNAVGVGSSPVCVSIQGRSATGVGAWERKVRERNALPLSSTLYGRIPIFLESKNLGISAWIRGSQDGARSCISGLLGRRHLPLLRVFLYQLAKAVVACMNVLVQLVQGPLHSNSSVFSSGAHVRE